MFGFGVPELLIIGAIVMVIFGVGKLPEIGSSVGKAISNFKKAAEGKDLVELNPEKDIKSDTPT
ncbi:MAG: twin-arginine translocase TatA/TatE family subunit [Desulfobulbaceae bacterium]|nr:twin-arginine translocase TatA/TatE family subunit [Desulfobulbaceae bacterium]